MTIGFNVQNWHKSIRVYLYKCFSFNKYRVRHRSDSKGIYLCLGKTNDHFFLSDPTISAVLLLYKQNTRETLPHSEISCIKKRAKEEKTKREKWNGKNIPKGIEGPSWFAATKRFCYFFCFFFRNDYSPTLFIYFQLKRHLFWLLLYILWD